MACLFTIDLGDEARKAVGKLAMRLQLVLAGWCIGPQDSAALVQSQHRSGFKTAEELSPCTG